MEITKRMCAWAAVAATYIVACLPNSFEVNNRLDGLEQEFEQTVRRTVPSFTRVRDAMDPYTVMSYDGVLDDIVDDRNHVLRKNDAVLIGSWTAKSYNGVNASPRTLAVAFCYNPFTDLSEEQK